MCIRDRYKVPRMVYVNKMDTMGADFFRCIKMLHDRLHANGVAEVYKRQASPFRARYLVIAAVRVVLPWST